MFTLYEERHLKLLKLKQVKRSIKDHYITIKTVLPDCILYLVYNIILNIIVIVPY